MSLANILVSETGVLNVPGTIQFVFLAILLIAIPLLIIFLTKRTIPTIISSVLSVICLLTVLFNLIYVFFAFAVIYLVFAIVFVMINLSSFRKYFIKKFEGTKEKKVNVKKDKGVTEIIDKNEVYNIIARAVKSFSRTKTGALITFERTDDLTPLMKNGTVLNAPLNYELLETIFYKGTRLHDGAVVIKGNVIVAASVYYNLTTRPLSGSYGTRHRAGLGISEVSDSITVIVSEETGRISIAHNAKLDPVSPESFERQFAQFMEEE